MIGRPGGHESRSRPGAVLAVHSGKWRQARGIIMISQLRRAIAWASLLFLAIASWTPGEVVVRSGYSGLLEHVVAYAIAAAAFALAYPAWPKWRIALGLCFYAAVLELGQSLVPGRGPALTDWATSAAGTCTVLIPLWLWSVRHNSRGGSSDEAKDRGSRTYNERAR